MANFDDITTSGNVTTGALFIGAQSSSGEQAAISPTVVPALAAGANHNVVLTGYNGIGYEVFQVSGASGAILSGCTTDNPAGINIQPGQKLVLVNTGANAIDVAANDGASLLKFALAHSIGAKAAVEYIYVGGLFYPLYAAATV